jgi:hypothetical protein
VQEKCESGRENSEISLMQLEDRCEKKYIYQAKGHMKTKIEVVS